MYTMAIVINELGTTANRDVFPRFPLSPFCPGSQQANGSGERLVNANGNGAL